mmetsp:Transcript_111471/g.320232  ORF Transcript_111471/g.320232 Transcript_111471/m.320232 type:complete len:226 (+) Transcript_111471:911-1588(+)
MRIGGLVAKHDGDGAAGAVGAVGLRAQSALRRCGARWLLLRRWLRRRPQGAPARRRAVRVGHRLLPGLAGGSSALERHRPLELGRSRRRQRQVGLLPSRVQADCQRLHPPILPLLEFVTEGIVLVLKYVDVGGEPLELDLDARDQAAQLLQLLLVQWSGGLQCGPRGAAGHHVHHGLHHRGVPGDRSGDKAKPHVNTPCNVGRRARVSAAPAGPVRLTGKSAEMG